MKLHALLWIREVQIVRVAKKRIFKEPLEVSFDFRKLTIHMTESSTDFYADCLPARISWWHFAEVGQMAEESLSI